MHGRRLPSATFPGSVAEADALVLHHQHQPVQSDSGDPSARAGGAPRARFAQRNDARAVVAAEQAARARRHSSNIHAKLLSILRAVVAIAILSAARAPAQETGPLPYGLAPAAQLSSRYPSEIDPFWDPSSVPARVRRGTFSGVDRIRLDYAVARVDDERAAVVIVTGRTENLLKYQEVVVDLVRQKYSVYVYDHRGQGFSERLIPDEPEKGHVERFDDYVDDLETFVQTVVKKDAHPKLFVLAHSMGGGIATRHLERFPGVFDAAALSSPMHQPNAKILISADSSCEWFQGTGWFFGQWWAGGTDKPYAHGPYVESSNEYTHSPERWARVLKVENESPKVRLGGPTRRWVAEACSASDKILAETKSIVTPVLVLQAGKDTAVMPDAQDAFCASLLKTTRRSCEGGAPQRIDGARHELLIEEDRYRVPAMKAILDFYAKHQGGT